MKIAHASYTTLYNFTFHEEFILQLCFENIIEPMSLPMTVLAEPKGGDRQQYG